MLNYKIWDRVSPINGCPADKCFEGSYLFEGQEVILIYDEKNPDHIIAIQGSKDYLYEVGDTVDDTAKRHIQYYIQMEEDAKKAQEEAANAPQITEQISFTDQQMEVINQMIEQAVNQTVKQMSDQITKQVQTVVNTK